MFGKCPFNEPLLTEKRAFPLLCATPHRPCRLIGWAPDRPRGLRAVTCGRGRPSIRSEHNRDCFSSLKEEKGDSARLVIRVFADARLTAFVLMPALICKIFEKAFLLTDQRWVLKCP